MTLAPVRRGMMAVCFLVWCLGQPSAPSERITFTHDIRGETRTERVASYEFRWTIGGFVQQHSRDAAFGGVLPLGIRMFDGHLLLDGGVVLASARVPGNGTAANFMTRAQLQVTRRFAITYWHWSNASLADSNPGAEFVGASVRLRSHGS
jgi:Lipid A 3-O-deacylase (PagL)